MALKWRPAVYMIYQGITVFHAYKDEFSDIPLENWFSLSEFDLPGSEYEFDIRELRTALRTKVSIIRDCTDEDVLKLAIDKSQLTSFLSRAIP
jgi:hypothetical protein